MTEQNSSVFYKKVFGNLKKKGMLQEWGLYNPKVEEKDGKVKPSRLPACTERVIYYSPASLLECIEWETTRGYEVNYLHSGSDHKPVILEATLKIGHDRNVARCISSGMASSCGSDVSDLPETLASFLDADHDHDTDSDDG